MWWWRRRGACSSVWGIIVYFGHDTKEREGGREKHECGLFVDVCERDKDGDGGGSMFAAGLPLLLLRILSTNTHTRVYSRERLCVQRN